MKVLCIVVLFFSFGCISFGQFYVRPNVKMGVPDSDSLIFNQQDTIEVMLFYIDTASQVYTGDLFNFKDVKPTDTVAILTDNNIHWMKGYDVREVKYSSGSNDLYVNGKRSDHYIYIHKEYLDENKTTFPQNIIVIFTK